MSLDIESLVTALSEASPAGPDLYGDPKRQQIEQAFERSISDGSGNDSSAAEWLDTIDLIIEQAAETRDLWLPVYLMRAAVHAGQFDQVVEASQFLSRLISERWDDVHPQLEDLGFIGRKTPCESLVRIGDFLGPLEKMPLIVHPRLGSFSGADVERFREKGPKAPGFGEFRIALDGLGGGAIDEALAGIDSLETAIRAVDATLTEKADGDTATNFKPTYDVLARMKRAVKSFQPKDNAAPVAAAVDAGEETESISASQGGAMAAGGQFSGRISSRDDAIRAIDAICDYYALNEPGSPVPFVLRRAREWISLDFMAVLEDIAPGSLDEATRVLKGRRAEPETDAGWGASESNEVQEEDWSSSEETSDDDWG